MTSSRVWIALLAVLLAFGFLGSRGIWDPDEGRYTNVALNMLDSGDWLEPRRNDDVGHWTKPPLTYWAIAASVAGFGQNPWAARLPAALSYLLCVWLVWRMARRLAPGTEDTAALAYATMLLPFGAAGLITTDYLLAACETLALWAFVEARFGPARRAASWLVLMWVGFALAFLTKGPPALLPLLVVAVYGRIVPAERDSRLFDSAGLAVFLLLALPWFVAVIANNPGLFEYFIGDEVVNRVTTNEFGRHGQWYGWLAIYLPTLLLGTLPWTHDLWRWLKALPVDLRRWRTPAARDAQRAQVLLALWLLLPLLVFCLARSRLPLYLLPLFAPLALLVASQRQREGRGLPAWRWLAAWTVLLLVLRLASMFWPTHKDAAAWADALRARAGGPVREVVFVEDMARYGLHLHLDAEIEKIELDPAPRARFNPRYDETLAEELAENEPHTLWVAKQPRWPELQTRIAAQGYRAQLLGTPYQGRVVFRIAPASERDARQSATATPPGADPVPAAAGSPARARPAGAAPARPSSAAANGSAPSALRPPQSPR
jgi:4-amino-4-deoxy-L-arabinose transferase-like glycosyltransferase